MTQYSYIDIQYVNRFGRSRCWIQRLGCIPRHHGDTAAQLVFWTASYCEPDSSPGVTNTPVGPHSFATVWYLLLTQQALLQAQDLKQEDVSVGYKSMLTV